jgi:hypothetical protein
MQQQGPATWSQVERLIQEQKFEEAAAGAEKLRLAAQKAGNQDEWTRALIKEVQLRTGLHGYETAVRFLKEQPWPQGMLNRAALNLFYAHSLVNYYHNYAWEINQRERVESKGTVDLKAWTKDQLYQEAQKAYEDVSNQRAALAAEPVARFADFLDRNNYPEGIRSTLRDTVSYLYAQLLSDTSLWTPQESNEIYRLDLKSLLSGTQKEIALSDSSVHPVAKISFILADLERWHAQNGRRAAALEARLERISDCTLLSRTRPTGQRLWPISTPSCRRIATFPGSQRERPRKPAWCARVHTQGSSCGRAPWLKKGEAPTLILRAEGNASRSSRESKPRSSAWPPCPLTARSAGPSK